MINRSQNKREHLIHNIKVKLKENIKAEIDRRVSEIENTQESSKMFKTVKMLKRQKKAIL